MEHPTRKLTTAAVTGAAYAVLTVVLAPISYGVVQFRLSEVLCVLPFFLPETAWGLFIGCAIANLTTGNLFDVVFGSLATLVSCLGIAALGKRNRKLSGMVLACALPVVGNGLVVGAVITCAYSGLGLWDHFPVFLVNAGWVALGEAGVLFLLGLPAMKALNSSIFLQRWLQGSCKGQS